MSDAELQQFREDQEADKEWRNISCHVVAEMFEACSICGMVREKGHLIRCPWCEDTYCCKNTLCGEQHRSSTHPAVAYWTW